MLLLVFSHWNPVPSQEAMIVEKTSTLNIYMLDIYICIITLVNDKQSQFNINFNDTTGIYYTNF